MRCHCRCSKSTSRTAPISVGASVLFTQFHLFFLCFHWHHEPLNQIRQDSKQFKGKLFGSENILLAPEPDSLTGRKQCGNSKDIQITLLNSLR